MGAPQLKTIYESQGKTREEVAEHMGVSTSFVYKWEKGTRNINGDQLLRLANFLACTTDELLTEPAYSGGESGGTVVGK